MKRQTPDLLFSRIPSTINPVRFRPTIEDLQKGDPHLPEFLRYIEHLVGNNDPKQAARNAALAYFASVRGMSNKGLVQMDWAPTVVIDAGDIEWEVCTFESPTLRC